MRELIEAWQGKRILVAGDPGYDCYHFGHVDRISPEAPVPVFVEDALETRPGLAYNVCQNLAALGCIPVQCFPSEPWTVKRRFMVGTHQLLRVDKDQVFQHAELSDAPDLADIDAVVFSDYDKGWLTSILCMELIIRANAKGIPTVVDPKYEWAKFEHCAVICPNQKEALIWPATWPGMRVLEKRGAEGLRLHAAIGADGYEDFPATARHVYDVTGAGDVVVAVLAAALSAGAALDAGARLANLAAGWSVGEVGTVACSAETLMGLL